MFDAASFKVKICRDPVHVSDKAPESVNLVLHHVQDWRQQVWHALKNQNKIMSDMPWKIKIMSDMPWNIKILKSCLTCPEKSK